MLIEIFDLDGWSSKWVIYFAFNNNINNNYFQVWWWDVKDDIFMTDRIFQLLLFVGNHTNDAFKILILVELP